MCMCVFVHALWSERENWGRGVCVGREEGGGLLKTLPANKQGGGQW